MRKLFLMALVLPCLSYAGTKKFSETPIRISNLSAIPSEELRAFVELKCEHHVFPRPGYTSCGDSRKIELKEGVEENSFVMPDLAYEYKNGYGRFVTIGLVLEYKKEQIPFGVDIKSLVSNQKNFKKAFSHITIYSFKPYTVKTIVNGMNLESWLSSESINSLDVRFWVTPALASGSVKPMSLHHYQELKLNDENVVSDKAIAVMGGPKDTAKMTIEGAISFDDLDGKPVHVKSFKKEFTFSQDLPDQFRTLDLVIRR